MTAMDTLRCKKCNHKIRTAPLGQGSDPYVGGCPCKDAPAGSTLVVGAGGYVTGWTAGPRGAVVGHYHESPPTPEPCAPSLATRNAYAQIAAASPILNSPLPAQTPGSSWEDDAITISIYSGDLVVEYARDHTKPAAQVEYVAAFGPHAHSDDARGSVRRIRVRLSDLERQWHDAKILCGGRASDSGAYARGVAAAREAIAAAKYDAERSHAEWSIRAVVVPEDK